MDLAFAEDGTRVSKEISLVPFSPDPRDGGYRVLLPSFDVVVILGLDLAAVEAVDVARLRRRYPNQLMCLRVCVTVDRRRISRRRGNNNRPNKRLSVTDLVTD